MMPDGICMSPVWGIKFRMVQVEVYSKERKNVLCLVTFPHLIGSSSPSFSTLIYVFSG